MCHQVLERHPGEIWEKEMNTTDAHMDNMTGTILKGRMNENENKDKCNRKEDSALLFLVDAMSLNSVSVPVWN